MTVMMIMSMLISARVLAFASCEESAMFSGGVRCTYHGNVSVQRKWV